MTRRLTCLAPIIAISFDTSVVALPFVSPSEAFTAARRSAPVFIAARPAASRVESPPAPSATADMRMYWMRASSGLMNSSGCPS